MNIKNHLFLSFTLILLSACQHQVGSGERSDSHVVKKILVSDAELRELTAYEILPILKSGEVSVESYMQALLAQTEKYDDELKAFISHEPEYVLIQARAADLRRLQGQPLGPLFGIPVSLKDLIVTKDLPTTFATKVFSDFKPKINAPAVDRLIAAGAIIFGKNNAQEWAFGSTGYNSHYGQQLNPYNTDYIAGGSSGGGVAAVAARMLPIAIGSDTAASIRVPAAYTGLYGLRPTIDRYDNSGVAPLAPTLDTIGPMTRSIEDMALIDSVLSGDDSIVATPKLSGLRLGVPKGFFHVGLSSEMRQQFTALLRRLSRAGVVLVEADLADAQSLNDQGLYPILFSETYPSISKFLAEWGDGTTVDELHAGLGADIKGVWDQLVVPGAVGAIPADVYKAAIEQVRPAMQASYRDYFAKHQVSAIIFPATASAAPLAKPDNPQETVIDGKSVSIFINDHNSSPGALAGQPGLVMPIAINTKGLPLGVSLDGLQGQDRQLLAVAKAIQAIIPRIPAPSL